MLRIAGQTAGPIGLKFFCGNLKVARGCYRLKKIEIRNFFPEFFFKFFFPLATPRALQLIHIFLHLIT